MRFQALNQTAHNPRHSGKLAIVVLCVFFFCQTAAALTFPRLTGRVVDDAHILSPQTIQSLDKKLEDYERGTGNQVVVATIPSLQGTDIEDYGYQLGRTWQIGQKGKDNGALLIVAPNERKVRIEVGYGLEPLLTDAVSSTIIQGIIIPAFRQNDMEKGVINGTDAVLSVLGGKGIPGGLIAQPSVSDTVLLLLLFLAFMIFASRHPFLAAWMLSSSSFRIGGRHTGDDGFGGFSGGGGSFGGGGASGSW
ncbi:MAG: TPM domain-containing protein [Alphaproteobacteria bacterium]|nr:TPM domain-containing protein [Alphaproteobacteria bacterium]